MIEKEELVTVLTELVEEDLSERGIEFIASELLEQFVLFERPEVQVRRDGTYIRLNDTRLTNTSLQFWQEHMDEADKELERYIEDYVSGHAVLALYAMEQEDAKAVRREELVKEAGADTFEDLPVMAQKLIIRLAEAEFVNARD